MKPGVEYLAQNGYNLEDTVLTLVWLVAELEWKLHEQ